MRRAVIYARYSAGPNQTDVSIEGQEKICRGYIERQGDVFLRMYADRHISGRTDRRPRFQDMIDDAKGGGFDVVVVYSLDRFSRDKYDSAIYKKVLREHGVVVESASESIPDGPEGILFEGMLEAMAEYYSAELSKKIRRGMDVKASKALSTGGPTPFGYVLKNGVYEKDEKAAPHVAAVFEKYAAGATFAECARYLNALGFTTSKGGPFASGAIKTILSNKKYAGYYVYNGTEIEGGMPALISEDLFFKVNRKMKENKPHRPRGAFALTGKLICSSCGSYMTGTSGTSKTGKAHYYYKCKTKDRQPVPRDAIEGAVADAVRDLLGAPESLDPLIDKLQAYQEEERRADAKTAALEDNLKATERQIKNVVDMIANFGGSQELADRLSALEADRAIMRADLEKLKTGPILSRDVIRQGLQLALLKERTSDAAVIRIFVHQVVLYDDSFLIEFNFKGAEGLERSDLLGFDLSGKWWSIDCLGRTLIIYRGRVLLFSPK